MITFPALQSWLGQELEVRGVDAVVYTRYILSILQQDSFEPESSEFDPFIPRREVRSTKGRVHQKKLRRSWTADERRKYAVLECLQAVTDKDCEIESLVEELCVKLKQVKDERDKGSRDGMDPGGDVSSMKPSTHQHDNPASQAAKYYQAFPALSDKTNTMAATQDAKSLGAWGYKKSLSPDCLSDTVKGDQRILKSVSASSSRASRSPTRKRTKSLPNNMAHYRHDDDDSVIFTHAKYPPKKAKGRRQAGKVKQTTPTNQSRKGQDLDNFKKTAACSPQNDQQCRQHVLHVTPCKSPEFEDDVEDIMVDEKEISWYNEPVIAVLDRGKDLAKRQTVTKAGVGSPRVPTGDTRFEEAVSSLAESLSRTIFGDDRWTTGGFDFDDEAAEVRSFDHLSSQVAPQVDGDMLERGRHGDKPDLLPLLDSRRPDIFADRERGSSAMQAMPLLVVDSQASLGLLQDLQRNEPTGVCHQSLASSASSIREHLFTAKDDFSKPEDAIGPSLSSIWTDKPSSALWGKPGTDLKATEWGDKTGGGVGRDYEQGLTFPANVGQSDDLPKVLKVVVNQEGVSRSAVGSATREEESLLRICCPTHSHHQCLPGFAPTREFQPGYFPFSEEVLPEGVLLTSPEGVDACGGDPGSPFFSESEQDSLAKGIKSAFYLDNCTPMATESFDINTALWSTYDGQPRYSHPSKIVRWEDGLHPREGPARRAKSSFIEGGVYGSPYSSQNNSHYSSCSTSPCEGNSLRDLWQPADVRVVSSLVSQMYELISPDASGRKLPENRLRANPGAATAEALETSSQQDEQSLIEDSLMDSPIFVCSRSSSRFDFARSVSDLDGSLSPVSVDGTETDDMVSEAELLEEALKDVGEFQEFPECNKSGSFEGGYEEESSDSHRRSYPTEGGSSEDRTPSCLTPPPPPEGGAAGLSDSLGLTAIVPTISRPEVVRKGKRPFDVAVGASKIRHKGEPADISSADMDDLLISPKTHFRPIHEMISPDGSSGEETTGDRLGEFCGRLGKVNVCAAVGSKPRTLPSESFSGAKPQFSAECAPLGIAGHSTKLLSEEDIGADCEGRMFQFEDEDVLQSNLLSDPGVHSLEPFGEMTEHGRPPWRKHRRKLGQESCTDHESLQDDHVSRKPCSFFLEGKCRRADCPFAHDVSRITCRFWEEEECFKGAECPFMHGYPSGKPSCRDMPDSDDGKAELKMSAVPPVGDAKACPIPTGNRTPAAAKPSQPMVPCTSPRQSRSLPIHILKKR